MATIRGSFAQSVNANSLTIMRQVNDRVYEIARELFRSIVQLTPSPSNPGDTAKGVLANNWFPADGPGFSQATSTARSSNGAASLARINALRGNSFFQKDGVVTLSNNLDYAYRAEVLGWPTPRWSGRVGPYRMVALSMQKTAARYK